MYEKPISTPAQPDKGLIFLGSDTFMKFEKATGIQAKTEKPNPFNWRRVVAMLFTLALATGIAVFALDGYEIYEEFLNNNHDLAGYIYENGEGYIGHEPYGYEYIDMTTISTPPPNLTVRIIPMGTGM